MARTSLSRHSSNWGTDMLHSGNDMQGQVRKCSWCGCDYADSESQNLCMICEMLEEKTYDDVDKTQWILRALHAEHELLLLRNEASKQAGEWDPDNHKWAVESLRRFHKLLTQTQLCE